MNDHLLECSEDQPTGPVNLQRNRIARLWGGDEEEVPQVNQWGPSSQHLGTLYVARRDRSTPANFPYTDPVLAGLTALVGQSEEVRWRSYTARVVAAFEARLERLVNQRVEAALAEKAEARRRADNLLENMIARLKEKMNDMELPSSEEAWSKVNFSTLGEDEE